STERALMEALREYSPEIATTVKSLMFVFDDLVLLDPRDLQKILMQVEQRDLALALKAAPEALQTKIFENVSDRVAQIVREEIEMLGSVAVVDVDEAQARILEAAAELEARGEVTLSRKQIQRIKPGHATRRRPQAARVLPARRLRRAPRRRRPRRRRPRRGTGPAGQCARRHRALRRERVPGHERPRPREARPPCRRSGYVRARRARGGADRSARRAPPGPAARDDRAPTVPRSALRPAGGRGAGPPRGRADDRPRRGLRGRPRRRTRRGRERAPGRGRGPPGFRRHG